MADSAGHSPCKFLHISSCFTEIKMSYFSFSRLMKVVLSTTCWFYALASVSAGLSGKMFVLSWLDFLQAVEVVSVGSLKETSGSG